MFARVLFLLLLALNIGGACWIAFARQPVAVTPSVSDPGVPKLVLLSERDALEQGSTATSATAQQAAATRLDDVCLSVGPFQTQSDMRATLNALTPHVRRIQYRDAKATQSRGYWVFLPAMKTRELALGVARELSAKGVRDYYVVTAGDQLNTISLGLFREKDNADRRRAEITGLGFSPQMIQRTEELPVYWIDFARAADRPVNWRTYAGKASDLKEQAIDCF
jgi:cell division septation protein DedD